MVFKMRYSGIGGQAVMEGVMMKNQEKYAVAVRKPDHEIEVKVSEYTGIIKNKKIRNMPILRGVFSFIESGTHLPGSKPLYQAPLGGGFCRRCGESFGSGSG